MIVWTGPTAKETRIDQQAFWLAVVSVVALALEIGITCWILR